MVFMGLKLKAHCFPLASAQTNELSLLNYVLLTVTQRMKHRCLQLRGIAMCLEISSVVPVLAISNSSA